MNHFKILTILTVMLAIPTFTSADNGESEDDYSNHLPSKISTYEAIKLAKKQGEKIEFSEVKWGNRWTIFESNNDKDDNFSDTRHCYWRIVVQNEKLQKQIVLKEQGGNCDRYSILEFKPVLLNKNILAMDLPTERGGIFYIFYLKQGDLQWVAQHYVSLDDDGLILKKVGSTIHAKTLTDKYTIPLDNKELLVIKQYL